MAKYLVTGGCGFIGSHVAEGLIARGEGVVIYDNLSTGKFENAPKEAEVIVADLRDREKLREAVSHVDGCFHLAAIASMTQSIVDLSGTHAINLGGTVNLIEAVIATGRKIPIVFASTAAVYGNGVEGALNEKMMPSPLSPYGVDKWGGERHLDVAWRLHGIPSFSFRLFNVYGPRQDPKSPYSGVISVFSDAIRQGKGITIYGDGHQVRDFIHVSDVAKGFLTAMASGKRGAFLFNLSTGKATSILKLAATLEKIAGRDVEKKFLPARSGDIAFSLGNPQAMETFFGMKADVELEKGLESLLGGVCAEFC